MAGALRAVCEEMGAVLVRSAHSANIKERRDASTALFTVGGEMVMQAEHIPVHLGAMPDSVAAVLEREQRPGDVWILNDPFHGGTHLPDITLVSPLFVDGRLGGYAANRAHHADVGGPTPGSMPFDSHTLADEGVLIPPTLIAPEGRLDGSLVDELTAEMRNTDQRRADLRAQLAANLLASRRFTAMAARHGLQHLESGMAAVLDYAERRTRGSIAAMPDGTYRAADVLEDDADGEHDLMISGQRDRRGRFRRRRLQRQRAAERRQPQLPAVGDEVGRLLRAARVHGPRHPVLRRRLPTGAGQRAARIARQREIAGGGRCRQRRDLQPDRRCRDARARRGARRLRAGTGHDEQPDARQRRLRLLRDDRRRPVRRAATTTDRRRCTSR